MISHKNSLAIKKGAALFKMASVKKSCKIKGKAKNWLWWYRLIAKNLIKAIQVNLCGLIPASLGISTRFTWIGVIKFFCHQPIPSQPIRGRPLWFHNFFTLVILNRAASFFTAIGCFCVDIIYFCNLTCILHTVDELYNNESSWTVYWATYL